jgi:hypothetical protein
MLFGNPEGLKTWEEIIEIAVSGMKPEHRARLESEAHATGRSVQEVAEAYMAYRFDHMEDLPNFDWEWQPYGKDPLFSNDGAR